MQVKSVGQNIGSLKNTQKRTENIQAPRMYNNAQDGVAFTGAYKSPNFIVWLMDFIAAGGFAASFCIQDGLGFITPRVYKGLHRGGKKKRDENGNEILNKNGEPKRELNWAYARKEGIREIITGPSAFIIPWLMLKGINKKFGTGNSVKLDYLDGFKNIFTDYAKDNIEAIKSGNSSKHAFYKNVYENILRQSINEQKDAIKLTDDELAKYASDFARKQIATEEINEAHKFKLFQFGNKKIRNDELAKLGSTIEDDYMALRKKHVGGASSDMAIQMLGSDNKTVRGGSIGELTKAMKNYFSDAVKNTHESLKNTQDADISEIVKKFTSRRMGSRILTNLGLFAAVALFYTQIPKLYNMGTGGKNPALMNDDEPALQNGATEKAQDIVDNKQVSFGGASSALEKAGSWVIGNSKLKNISDIFELNGPIIQGNAMAVLLYGACIPPRLVHAQDKYDYGEILVRDMTAFTALLFGAKALARLFSDGFTKLTGLALNSKDMKDRSTLQKVWDYLNPSDARHSILSSKELDSKYTHIDKFKGGIDGFIEFIEKSGGNIRKAFANDSKVKEAINNILKDSGKTFEKATVVDIKKALHNARVNKDQIESVIDSIEKSNGNIEKAFVNNPKIKAAVDNILKDSGKTFEKAAVEDIKKALHKLDKLEDVYKLFRQPNKLLNRAKTCNSFFGALSTLFLVPGLIIALTDICKAMTDKKKAEENRIKNQTQAQRAPLIPSSKPTMAGFLNKNVS